MGAAPELARLGDPRGTQFLLALAHDPALDGFECAEAALNLARAENRVTLCDLRVFVDKTAKAVAPDDTPLVISGGRFRCADGVRAALSQ